MSQAIEISTWGLLRMAGCGFLESRKGCPAPPSHLTSEEPWLEPGWGSGSGNREQTGGVGDPPEASPQGLGNDLIRTKRLKEMDQRALSTVIQRSSQGAVLNCSTLFYTTHKQANTQTLHETQGLHNNLNFFFFTEERFLKICHWCQKHSKKELSLITFTKFYKFR